MTEIAFLSLGSNLDPERHLIAAVRGLSERLDVVAVSRVYETTPVGPAGERPFLNAAARLAVDLPPRALKWGVLRPLEAELGRLRDGDRFAPRPIDIDLVLYGDLVADLDGAPLPDPALLTCPHLAVPVAELDPERRHPLTGERLRRIAERTRRLAGPGWRERPDVDLTRALHTP